MSLKLWNEKSIDYIYYYDISSFISLIRTGKFQYDFSFKSKYICGEEINNPLEQKALEGNYDVLYTDKNHPICIGPFESYIDKDFFEMNKEIILKEIRKQVILDTYHSYIVINKYIFSDDFLKELVDNYKGQHIIFKDTFLNDEQKRLLIENHIYSDEITNGVKKSISIDKENEFYSYDFERSKNVTIYSDISNKEINDFKESDELIITIDNVEEDEEGYYKKALIILEKFDKLDKKFTIKVKCNKRSLFDKYFSEKKYNNINLLVNNDFYDYPIEEYLNEEKILNLMVNNINDSNCTPFEKYIAVYNIVKNFKPYNEEKEGENPELSRNIKFILNSDYMVCVGFSKLFRELLDKVGIEASIYNTSVDISYDDGFTLEDIPINNVIHSRVLVNLVDEKYDINGYYISDPTWDNDNEIDKYSNMIMPFDYMQKSARLFKLEEFDFIFDVHNLNEFNSKVKLLIEKKVNKKVKDKKEKSNQTYNELLLESYFEIISLINNIIKEIDYEKYKEISEVFDNLLYKKNDTDILLNNCIYFINYIGVYIVKKSNNELEKKTIIEAIGNSKVKTNKLLPEELNEYIKFLSKEFELQDSFDRPYNFPRNYLSENDDGVKNEKKIL